MEIFKRAFVWSLESFLTPGEIGWIGYVLVVGLPICCFLVLALWPPVGRLTARRLVGIGLATAFNYSALLVIVSFCFAVYAALRHAL